MRFECRECLSTQYKDIVGSGEDELGEFTDYECTDCSHVSRMYDIQEYKCIKEFDLPICDGDGFETEEFMVVKEGTLWYPPENPSYRFVGGEIRLESDELGWIEISKDTFNQCFKEVSQVTLQELDITTSNEI